MWRYCIPLLGSVIFQQLYNIADSLVAGKYVGKNALAAVGNSYEITLIYMAFAFGCNMGCSVIAAQFFGAKNYRKMKTTVYTTFIYSAVLCLILTLTGLFAGGALLHLIHTPADIFAGSKLYLDVYTGGLVFLFFYNIATGIFSALGDSKTPFIFLAFSSVSNVFVDILGRRVNAVLCGNVPHEDVERNNRNVILINELRRKVASAVRNNFNFHNHSPFS